MEGESIVVVFCVSSCEKLEGRKFAPQGHMWQSLDVFIGPKSVPCEEREASIHRMECTLCFLLACH